MSGGQRRQRLVILAGAPTQSALERSSVPPLSQQASPYLPAFRRFFKMDCGDGGGGGSESEPAPILEGEGDKGPWRELSLSLNGGGDNGNDDDNELGVIADVPPQEVSLPEEEEGATIILGPAAVVASADPASEAQTDDDQAAAAQLLHDDKVAAGLYTDEADSVDEDFLSHSFTCYNTAPLSSPPSHCSQIPTSSNEHQMITSQLPAMLHQDSLDLNHTPYKSFTSFHTSFNSTASSYGETAASQSLQLPPILPPLPPLSSLTDLEDLPSPKKLERLQSHSGQIPPYRPKPISTIVGIISVSQPILCRSGSEMVKLVVGDETASGVGVTIWLDSALGIRDKLHKGSVRPLDVVLLRNLSMNVYNGKVYLNSMRNKTELELLYRCGERIGSSGLDLVQEGAFKDQQLEKVRRVVQWMVGFVGGGRWRLEGAEGDQTILPEDTQLDVD